MKEGKKGTWQHLTHDDFGPLYDSRSEILILGSFPSVKSREEAFFYGHKQNRFWPLMARILRPEEENPPRTKEEKAKMMLENHIALWDVIESCDIIGSSDASIRNVQITNLNRILDAAPIRRIYLNGAAAYRYYQKYTVPQIGERVTAVRLPSTSPANAAWPLERLYGEWKQVGEALHKTD